MTIEQLWQELEAESGANIAWLTRFAHPKTGHPLLVSLEQATRSRALLVPISKISLPPRREWPECRGLELISVTLNSQPHLGVRLRDRACADVFTALAEDVAPRIAAASGPKQAALELLERLRRWQKFLTAARDGLSIEAQRGLWGELHTFRTHLLPVMGADATVTGWKASAAAHQDFQFSNGAVEVKITVAKQPQSVRITSERQLDDTGVGALFLHVVVADEREVAPSGNTSGQSLPGIIAEMRTQLGGDAAALATFNDCLLDAGWLDAQAVRYETRRWTVRKEHSFQVRRGFSRLVEGDLPNGVGDVNYALNLAVCAPFAVPVSAMMAALTRNATRRKKSSSHKS